MKRVGLLPALLSAAALACSLGGSASPEPVATEAGPSGGVAVSKATPTTPEEIVLPTATEVPPTATPEPTKESAHPGFSIAPENEGMPIEIIDLNFLPGVGVPRVYGIFRNIGEFEVSTVEIAIFFHDANGEVTGMASGFSYFQRTAPGEVTPFDIPFLEGVPEEFASVSFGARWNPAEQDDNIRRQGFEVEVLKEDQDSFAHEIDISVTNNNERTARTVFFGTLFYNAGGRLIGLDLSSVDDLEAGETDFLKLSYPFEFLAEPEFDHYEILLEGYLPSP